MEVLSGIVNFITTYIFNQPFILLSLVAMLGLILQKKPLQDIIVGSLKTGIGYLILSQGTSLLARPLRLSWWWALSSTCCWRALPNSNMCT